MLISTRGRYALRVMIDLAEQNTDKYIPMKDIAARQEISLKYLEKILPVLVANGIIEGVHGKGGGYKLTRKPEEYLVGDILRLTEGEIGPISCDDCNPQSCPRTEFCRTKPMWDKLKDMINAYFDGVTIADLMKNNEL